MFKKRTLAISTSIRSDSVVCLPLKHKSSGRISKQFGQVCLHVQSVSAGRSRHRIDHGADLRSLDRGCEQPVVSTDAERSNRILSAVVIDGDLTGFEKSVQITLLIQGILCRFRQCRLPGYSQCILPCVKSIKHRLRL